MSPPAKSHARKGSEVTKSQPWSLGAVLGRLVPVCLGGLATAAGFPGKADQGAESPGPPAPPARIRGWNMWLFPPESPADPWACSPAPDLRAGGRRVGLIGSSPVSLAWQLAPMDGGWDARGLAKTPDSLLGSDPHHPIQQRAGSCEVQRKWQGIGLQW